MAVLLIGLKTSLYMTNRLKAYVDYLRYLPTTQTRANFELALAEFYTLMLQFLSRAIQIYEKGSLARAFDAFWKTEEVHDFEDRCDKIAKRAEEEASNCDRTLHKEHFETVLKEIGELRTLSICMLIDKLNPLQEAAFDPNREESNEICCPDTRTDLLRQIREWAHEPQGRCVFWLSGQAGTGKSTISRTMAPFCRE
jgi:hypothetical protein